MRLIDQVDEVSTDLLRAELIRGLLVVLGQLSDGAEVGLLSVGRQVAHLHVFEHASAQRGHDQLL